MRTGQSQLFITVISFLFLMDAFAQEIPVLEWARGMGGTGGEIGKSVAVDASGNVITTGYFDGTADFDSGPGTYNLTSAGGVDIFISKLDASGNFVWAKQLGGISTDLATSIAVDAVGNVLITGYFQGTSDFDPGPGTFNLTSAGGRDVFISKLDALGNLVWAKQLGGTSDDMANSIAIDASGNVLTTGLFANSGDFDPSPTVFNLISSPGFPNDIFISKLDASGNFIWAKRLGGAHDEESISIAVDASGNVFTAGYFEWIVDFDPGAATFNLTSLSTNDIFISKLDASGNFVWAKQLGGGSSDAGFSIAIDVSGNVLTTGYFQGTGDFNPGAGTFNLTSTGGLNVFISKLDASGNFAWAKAMGATTGFSIDTDALGNVFTTGHFQGTVDFDPGAGTSNLTSAGIQDIFISKLDASGNFVWAKAMGGTSSDYGNSIAIDASGNLFTTGYFYLTSDFDPGPCIFNLISAAGTADFFVQKLSIGTTPPAPTITSFSPTAGAIGTPVTITGTNFSTTPASNVVQFFNNKTSPVTASTATSLATTVPTGAITGKISVTVNCITVQSATDFTVGAAPIPTITSFAPTTGPIGTTVTVTGTNFSTSPGNNTVRFNGTLSTVTSSTATSLTTTVPAGATTGVITVVVAGNTATSATNFTVTTVSPSGELKIHNGLSPNKDNRNDIFYIENIDILSDTKENKVLIFNRWGDMVYEMTNYNNADRVFTGLNKNGDELPTGTYYYKIEFASGRITQSGYLSLKR